MKDAEMSDDPTDMAAELRARLFNVRETRPGSHLYLMLDNACPVAPTHPLGIDELDRRPVRRERASLARRGMADADEAWQPFLLQVYRAGENGYVDEELLDLALATARSQCTSVNGAYVAAWIASDLDPAALASRLGQACELFDFDQGRHRHMPLHEPHRMALLADDPDAAAFMQNFLKAVHLWAFVDAAGELRAFTSVEPASAGHPAPVRALNLAQCRAQGRVALARLALLGLVKAGQRVPRGIERGIDALLVQAAQLGLVHDEDVVFFVLNGLTLPGRWHEHPQARRCIERSRDDGMSLAGLMSELPDEVLDQIGQAGHAR